MKEQPLTHLSLFTGIGGLDLAVVPQQFYPIYRAIAEIENMNWSDEK